VQGLRSVDTGTAKDISASLADLAADTNADTGVVTLLRNDFWVPIAAIGAGSGWILKSPVRVERHAPLRAMHTGKPLLFEDISRSGAETFGPRARVQLRRLGARAFATMPIVVHGRLIGAVSISSKHARRWEAPELRYLRFSARHIGLVIEAADRLRENEERLRALTAISEASALITESLDLKEVLQRIAHEAQHVIGASTAHVLLLDPETGVLQGAAATAPWAKRIHRLRIRVNDSIAETAIRAHKTVVVEDARKDPRVSKRMVNHFRTRALMLVPLFAAGRTLGVLSLVDTERPRRFGRETIRQVETLANHAAVAIDHARLHEELRSRERELRTLSGRITDAHESERRRISRELHDVIGQGLAAIGLELAAAEKTGIGGAFDPDRVNSARKLLRETAQAARRLSAELHPGILDDLGLVPALRWYCGEFARRSSLKIDLEAGALPEIAAPAAAVLYRAVQEGLSNVLRHAGATRAIVALRRDGTAIRLELRDDGRGVSRPGKRRRPGVGLLAIRERAAALGGVTKLEPSAERGAQLVVELPLLPAKPAGDSNGRAGTPRPNGAD